MSAYVVDKAHINLLVDAAVNTRAYVRIDGEYVHAGKGNADKIGQILLDENVKSVCHLYDDNEMTDIPGRTDAEYLIPFKYRPWYERSFKPVDILSALACYEYQSCEHPEWKDSDAKVICERIQSAQIRKLPGWSTAIRDFEEWPSGNVISLSDLWWKK